MNRAGWKSAAVDFSAGASRTWLWGGLGWNDIRHRYSGSVLGSVWITANIGLLTLCLTLVFAGPLGTSHALYVPYVATGLVFWYLIQTVLSEAPNVFATAAETIRHSPMPLTVHVLRLVWRNLIVFAHNAIVIPLTLVAFTLAPSPWLLAGLLALPLLAFNLVALTFILGLLGARFRDVQQIVTTMLPILFFGTPIVWFPTMLEPERGWIAAANPIFAFIDLVRSPLLGTAPMATSWPVALLVTAASTVIAAIAFGRYRDRVAYWV